MGLNMVMLSMTRLLGQHYSDKFFGQGQLEQMVICALTGRNDGGCDDNCSEFVDCPNVD